MVGPNVCNVCAKLALRELMGVEHGLVLSQSVKRMSRQCEAGDFLLVGLGHACAIEALSQALADIATVRVDQELSQAHVSSLLGMQAVQCTLAEITAHHVCRGSHVSHSSLNIASQSLEPVTDLSTTRIIAFFHHRTDLAVNACVVPQLGLMAGIHDRAVQRSILAESIFKLLHKLLSCHAHSFIAIEDVVNHKLSNSFAVPLSGIVCVAHALRQGVNQLLVGMQTVQARLYGVTELMQTDRQVASLAGAGFDRLCTLLVEAQHSPRHATTVVTHFSAGVIAYADAAGQIAQNLDRIAVSNSGLASLGRTAMIAETRTGITPVLSIDRAFTFCYNRVRGELLFVSDVCR